MLTANLIDAIRLPFRKEKELYRSFYDILGFYPHRIALYQEALMHRSMAIHADTGMPINNERLEFLGDAILEAVVSDIVFRHFKGKKEGFLTNTRSKIVQRESLGQLAVQIGLDKLIHSNHHSNAHNSYMAGNAFEALVGAIYLDRGYGYCMRFVHQRILNRLLDIDKVARKEVNFKSKLLEWCQKRKACLEFVLISEGRSENGAPTFKSKVTVNGIELGRGSGFSKKESQQQACKNAIQRIRNNPGIYETLKKTNDNLIL